MDIKYLHNGPINVIYIGVKKPAQNESEQDLSFGQRGIAYYDAIFDQWGHKRKIAFRPEGLNIDHFVNLKDLQIV